MLLPGFWCIVFKQSENLLILRSLCYVCLLCFGAQGGHKHLKTHLSIPDSHSLRIDRSAILAFSWLAGFLSGMLFSLLVNINSSYFREWDTKSFPGVFVVSLFPLILTLICFLRPVFCYLVAFLKASFLGFSATVLLRIYPQSAWLISFFLFFSDILFQPFLYTLWLVLLNYNSYRNVRNNALVCLVFAVLTAAIDYFYVSPYFLSALKP